MTVAEPAPAPGAATRPTADEPVALVDLFAGCGGFTRGFTAFRPAGRPESAGPVFRSVLAIERDPDAAATYTANFHPEDDGNGTGHVHTGDIEHWQPTGEEAAAEVVLGGPPCQGFSGLGKRDPEDPRNKLWRHYVRIVSDVIRPKVFVIENVDRFLTSPEFHDLEVETRPGGELADYRLVDPPGAEESDTPAERRRRYLLNAADYGVPQTRRRAIVIGVRKDVPGLEGLRYPGATHARPGRRCDLPPWRTVAPIFERSAAIPLRDDLPPSPDGWWPTTALHLRRNPEPLSLARYAAIPPGGNRKHLTGVYAKTDRAGRIRLSHEPGWENIPGPATYLSTPSWDNHRSGSGDVMGRLYADRPSVTIRTEFYKPEKGRYLHPTENRPITHLEAALIQGFPDDFRWCGSRTSIARQIGNAVPVGLGTAVAGAVHRALRG
ncbi:DNA (cytosine-5-)-methyltransferase [Streptomyces sp. IF17]|nr:DNA cytosine methyltransferase [Streptomyces alkaliphilus]MQS09184.1 DNA (cytosine-5-)-methyltransferase [Streptomyces alkaliphilus]